MFTCCFGTPKIAPSSTEPTAEAPRRNAARNPQEIQADLFALAIGNSQPIAKDFSPHTVTLANGNKTPPYNPFITTQKTSPPSSGSTH